MITMLTFHIIVVLTTTTTLSHALLNPQLSSRNGNLVFQAADVHNISFRTINGGIYFNNINLASLSRSTSSRSSTYALRRLNTTTNRNIRMVKENLERLTETIEQLQRDLETDECLSNPCQHSGQCFDAYKKFQCRCTDEWMGTTCTDDVNECYTLQGTDMGCQNEAQCVNLPGSFKCNCKPHWYGPLCNVQVDNCQNASSHALCGHGTCVNQSPSVHGGAHYKCLCDTGWKTDGVTPHCNVDIDECSTGRSPCDSLVHCENLPGSFRCGPCPFGYTGNGHRCTDINECLSNNGGCSVSPFVRCNNNPGSFSCDSCPRGFAGDGRVCRRSSACDNHDCNSMAICIDTPGVGSGRRCECQGGLVGNGIGVSGCSLPSPTDTWIFDACASNPCMAGYCVSTQGSYTCNCPADRAGTNCELASNACSSSPCLNNGTCVSTGPGSFSCSCNNFFTGDRCQTHQTFCGDSLTGSGGVLSYPVDTIHYAHNLECTFTITSSDYDKIIMLNFTKFDLERDNNCQFDQLFIYNGESARGPQVGKYCGNSLQGKTINSTGHALTLFFKTDHADSATGFNIIWSTHAPTCGELKKNVTHGTIVSPGYPGQYPLNRDCRWIYEGVAGSFFNIHFGQMALEHHDNCEYDFLEVRDGPLENSPLLTKACSTVVPQAVKTTGPIFQVYFHSDHSDNDMGFLLTYAIEQSSECGGTFTAYSGFITSPGFPHSYEKEMHCSWLIAPPNSQLSLIITNLDIEDDFGCEYDYVEVRRGDDGLAPVIGKFCGTTLPQPISVHNSNLFITLKTDDSVEMGGFRAEWITECSGTFVDRTGIIKSPGFPSGYPANQTCTYTIESDFNSVVELELKVFNLHYADNICSDYLLIKPQRTENQLLCGNEVQRSFVYQGPVVMEFHSDSHFQATGFEIRYFKYNSTITNSEPSDDEDESSGSNTCGGVLKREAGVIHSPNMDLAPHNVDCTWVIEVNESRSIELSFEWMRIEEETNCSYDYLQVFNDKHSNASLGRFCGISTPNPIRSTGNHMSIHFHTDHSETSEGFTLIYHSVGNTHTCGGTLSNSQGVITSPGFPARYQPRSCEWIIKAGPNKLIHLNIITFALEDSSNCMYDYLEIRNGGYSTAPLVGKYCSTNIPSSIMSHSNSLYIKFHTDDDTEEQGFKILYDATTEGCGGTLRSQSGSFTSPNYPAAPYRSGECFWKIVTSKGSRIKLHFPDFDVLSDTSCLNAYVLIKKSPHDGTGTKTCGSNVQTVFESDENEMEVMFKSGAGIGSRGFMASFYTDCNSVLSGLEEVIESPNYPSTFSSNLQCTWTIVGIVGNKMILEMNRFRMNHQRDCHDYVEIFDSSSQLLRKVCNDSFEPMQLEAQNITVKFTSGPFGARRLASDGFKLTYRSEGCGGTLESYEGMLNSPNYPLPYTLEQRCHWVVKVDDNMRINFTIHDIDIENHDNCSYDYLKIYSGSNDKSRLITTMCHSDNKGKTFTTSGNVLFIDFLSDHSQTGKGFNMSWNSVPNECNYWFTLRSAAISSPNYPNPYEHHLRCIWNIQTEEGSRIKLTITDFDLEYEDSCTYDSLRIYGDHRQRNLLRQLCGQDLSLPLDIYSEENHMSLLMLTDESTAHKGFTATYYTECGGLIKVDSDEYGILSSPGYPSAYDNKKNCTWIITNENLAEKITIEFVFFQLEVSGNCHADYLTIYNGIGLDAPMVDKYCGLEAPPPFTSSGSALTLNFNTDASQTARGFRLVYTRSTSACGLNYNVESGTINSPNFPDVYPNNIQCTWNITGTKGSRVELTFLSFSLEGRMGSCNEDQLQIRWANQVEILCSDQVPNTRILEASSVLLLLQTNSDQQFRGFSLKYKTIYGGHMSNWKEGSIESPGYPSLYGNDRDINWLLTPPNGQTIRFIFEKLDLEQSNSDVCHDFVEIKTGMDPEGTQYCSKELPPPFVTSDTPVKIKFFTDYSEEGTGFRLTWKADEVFEQTSQFIPYTPPNCGGRMVLDRTSNFTITSPSYPADYGHNLNCKWTIKSLSGFIQFTIEDLYIEYTTNCEFDSLGIIDVHGNTPELKLCSESTDNNNKRTIVKSNEANVVFVTDVDTSYRGFKLHVTTTCDSSFEHNSGVVTSPNYSNNYAPSMNCSSYIKVQQGLGISLSFIDFDVACSNPSEPSNDDHVEIYEGSELILVKQVCGGMPQSTITSLQNQLLVRFISNGDSRVGKGFKAVYLPLAEGCGHSFELSTDIPEYAINSPSYPNNYDMSSNCEWIITTQGNKRLTATFNNIFKIAHKDEGGCYRDSLTVRDGNNERAPRIGIYCGDQAPDPITSSGSALYFRFVSDLSEADKGFRVTVRQGICGGTFVQPQGTITSPNYPASYPSNQVCQWVIEVPINHYVTLSFEHLQLEDCRDKIIIRDYNSTGPVISEVCQTKVTLSSAANVVVIQINTTYHSLPKSFKLNYISSSEVCGGEHSLVSGSIESPNFPHPLSRRRLCEWTIKAPVGKRVDVNFTELDLVSGSNWRCEEGRVTLRNGMFEDSPVLFTGCHFDRTSYFSTYNVLVVRYWVSASNAGKGFRLNYKTTQDNECSGWHSRGNLSIVPAVDINWRNLECVFQINFPTHSASRTISFKSTISFTQDAHRQFIQFTEYPSNRKLGTFSSDKPFPPSGLLSASASVKVRVFSVSSHMEHFNLSYSFNDCGGMISEEGYLGNTNYPLTFGPGINCMYHITAPPHNIIKFIMDGFANSELNCDESFVELRNGVAEDSPTIFKTCKGLDQEYRTQSNAARIGFFSTSSASKPLGFHFRVEFVSKGCGGWFHGKEGFIHALNWPNSTYDSRVQCHWKVSVPKGFHVTASFKDPFQARCTDILEVSSPGMQSLNYCQDNRPSNITVSTNELNIRMLNQQGSRGFGLEYKAVCGMNFSTFEDKITTPDFPRVYQSSSPCTHYINLPETLNITFAIRTISPYDRSQQFDDYGLQRHIPRTRNYYNNYGGRIDGSFRCGDNYVEMGSLNGQQVKTVCDFEDAESHFVKAPAYVKFVPGSSEGHAFSVEYRVLDCNATFTDESGKISSPHIFPIRNQQVSCSWNIQLDNSRMIIRFTLKRRTYFGACRSHSFKIFDVIGGNNLVLVKELCRTSYLRDPFYSNTNSVRLKYQSTGFSRANSFELLYQGVYRCTGVRNESSGYIETINNGQPGAFYEPNLNCRWLLNGPVGHIFVLTWQTLSFPNTSHPCDDYLEIYDTVHGSRPTLKVCETRNNLTYYSARNQLELIFVSDSSQESNSMKVHFQQKPRDCGGILNLQYNEANTLQSPPYRYFSTGHLHLRCQWLIKAPAGKHVELNFRTFDVPETERCQDGYLLLSQSKYPKITYLCGKALPSVFISKSNELFLTYYTVNQGPEKHANFDLSYKISSCNRQYRNPGGNVQSDGFRELIQASFNCTYTFDAPQGYGINLVATRMSISDYRRDSCVNYLEVVYAQNGTTSAEKYCRELFYLTIPSTHVTVRYFNTGSRSSRGFEFTYNMYPLAAGCGGVLTGKEGTITHPDFPAHAQRPYNCTWTIVNPRPYSLVVRVNLERERSERHASSRSCGQSGSWLSVSNGVNSTCHTGFSYRGNVYSSALIERNVTVHYVARNDSLHHTLRFKFERIDLQEH